LPSLAWRASSWAATRGSRGGSGGLKSSNRSSFETSGRNAWPPFVRGPLPGYPFLPIAAPGVPAEAWRAFLRRFLALYLRFGRRIVCCGVASGSVTRAISHALIGIHEHQFFE